MRETVTARWQHYLVSLRRATIGMRMTVKRSSRYKMAAPLNTRTTIEQRGAVRFLWAKVMAAKDIHKEMLPMYGEHCLSRQAVLQNNIFRGNAFLTTTQLKE